MFLFPFFCLHSLRLPLRNCKFSGVHEVTDDAVKRYEFAIVMRCFISAKMSHFIKLETRSLPPPLTLYRFFSCARCHIELLVGA